MQIQSAISIFLDYLVLEKGLSKNTIESYKNDLDEFNVFLRKYNCDLGIENIDKKTMLEYYKFVDKKEYSKATLQRKYSALNQFFKYFVKQERLPFNPMLSMRRQKKELKLPKYLTEDEIEKLISVNSAEKSLIEMRNKLIIEMLYSTGMRVSEICNLPLNAVVFDKTGQRQRIGKYEFITIKGKGQKERIVPLKAEVIRLLQEYVKMSAKNGQKYLFASCSKDGHITRQMIGILLKKTAILAGINPEKVHPHIIRHSFATHLLQKGLDIREIQELLGHSSIDTTAIYAKINTATTKQVLQQYHPLAK